MRSIIDRDIVRLEENIRALKSRRNELSPISRLPVELLCKIFSLIGDDNGISYFKLGRFRESWSNFSQVSRHWRSSALSAPELWTKIPLNYPRWAQEMLLRSKMAKLTIRSGSSFESSNPKKYTEIVKSCLNQMIRVEEIKLTAIPGSILEEIFRDVPKSAPQLHTLCIGGGGHSFRFTETGFSIREDFLHDTERLQYVELIKCKISWDCRLLTGLTRLTLEDSLNANSSVIQVLHALQRMPALTDLCLKNAIPDDSKGLSNHPDVDLPCLRELNISSGIGPLTAVLRHITFPNTAILNLTCRETHSTQIDFSNFFSILSTKFLSSLVIRSLSLRVPDYSQAPSLELYFWTASFIHDCFPPQSSRNVQCQLQIVLTWPSSQRQNYGKALTSAFDAMSLPFLAQLQISTEDCIDSNTWVKTFGKLPLLERVCVHSCLPYSFLEALVYKTKAAEKLKAAYRSVSFPKLRYLHLEGTDFDAIPVDKLLDYLMERCERKAAIQVLRLDECYYITYDDVERLEEVVVDVIWDGVEQEISEEDSEEEEREYDSEGNVIEDYDYSSYDDFPVGYW
jgi:hypothetical protein